MLQARHARQKSERRRGEHDQRERHIEEEDADESEGGDRVHQSVAQRAPADAHNRIDDDGENGGTVCPRKAPR